MILHRNVTIIIIVVKVFNFTILIIIITVTIITFTVALIVIDVVARPLASLLLRAPPPQERTRILQELHVVAIAEASDLLHKVEAIAVVGRRAHQPVHEHGLILLREHGQHVAVERERLVVRKRELVGPEAHLVAQTSGLEVHQVDGKVLDRAKMKSLPRKTKTSEKRNGKRLSRIP